MGLFAKLFSSGAVADKSVAPSRDEGLGSSLAFCLLHLLSPRHNAPDAENRQASKIAPGNWTRGR